MSENEKCLMCGRTSDEAPLLVLRYKDQDKWVCPQHLPILIHKPQQIADQFPGASFATPEGH